MTRRHHRMPNRPHTTVETPQYAAFVRRAIAGYARRVGAGDVEALPGLVELLDVVNDAITDAVTGLRAFGYSWADIANRLGVTRSAAHERWATRTTPNRKPNRNGDTP